MRHSCSVQYCKYKPVQYKRTPYILLVNLPAYATVSALYSTVLYCTGSGTVVQHCTVQYCTLSSPYNTSPSHLCWQNCAVLYMILLHLYTVYVSYHVISAFRGEVTNMLTAFCTDIRCSYAIFRCPSLSYHVIQYMCHIM